MPVELYIKDGANHHHSLGSEPLLQRFSCDNIVGFLFVCCFGGWGWQCFIKRLKCQVIS